MSLAFSIIAFKLFLIGTHNIRYFQHFSFIAVAFVLSVISTVLKAKHLISKIKYVMLVTLNKTIMLNIKKLYV